MSYKPYFSGDELKLGRYSDRDLCTSTPTVDKPDVVGEVGVLHLPKRHMLYVSYISWHAASKVHVTIFSIGLLQLKTGLKETQPLKQLFRDVNPWIKGLYQRICTQVRSAQICFTLNTADEGQRL